MLSVEEARLFFNKVKGRKIRWTGWQIGRYFIPLTFDGSTTNPGPSMLGVRWEDTSTMESNPNRERWYVIDGFDGSERGHWEVRGGAPSNFMIFGGDDDQSRT